MARNADQAGGAVPPKHPSRSGSAILEGGSELLLERIADRIRELGGTIELSATVESIAVDDSHRAPAPRDRRPRRRPSTVRSTLLSRPSRCPMSFPSYRHCRPTRRRASRRSKTSVLVCVLLKLKRPFSRNFWMNINDPRIEIPGLIRAFQFESARWQRHPVRALLHASHPSEIPPRLWRLRRGDVGRHAGHPPGLRSPRRDRQPQHRATTIRRRSAPRASTPKLPAMRSQVAGLFLADTLTTTRKTDRSPRVCGSALTWPRWWPTRPPDEHRRSHWLRSHGVHCVGRAAARDRPRWHAPAHRPLA